MIPIKPKDVTWTDEQWQAIYEDGKNIIVSAGAGSGKTAVLTERVIRKLKDGVHINELLILTFTKAAASEMADRIRKKIKKVKELSDELNLLDSAYITTFDSFALSVVKRYHYLINVSNDIGIIDSNVIAIKKNKIMEEIFLEFYEKKDSRFLRMIKNFCLKDDLDIRNYILNISNKLDLLSNKREYLEKYLSNYFEIDKINKDIDLYVKLIKEKISIIKLKVEEIGYIDGEFAGKVDDSLKILYEAIDYDSIVERLNVKLPIAPRGSEEELKKLKLDISNIIKEIKALAAYNNKDSIVESINSTYDTVSVIIDIILEFTDRVMAYKKYNNCYEFNDIAIMAINILKNNSDVREELLNSFNEIMIDEYQDTNDLQEEFISMISNHNVYMVGDIKQSIYRFRNANPYIFKEKYNDYSSSDLDMKIDLNKNFRSRREVLNNVNTIFNLIMDLDIGGADYIKDHQMIFGNQGYLEEKVEHSNEMDFYKYCYDKELGFTKEEIEAFIIAKDVLNKYNSKYQVYDKDDEKLRDIMYSDFSIILDRATNFDLYKKVFSYFGIPITLLKDEKMNDSMDISVIRNLIRLIIVIKNKVFDTEFKYLFVSLLRSFLYNVDDDVIFNYFISNNFKDSDLYKKCLEISKKLDYITISNLIDIIVLEFDYYNKLITIGNINNSLIRLDKIREMGSNLENLGYDVFDFSDYLTELTSKGYNMEYKSSDVGSDAVKVMTIHKSKGLEYAICYFSGLYKLFNISDLKEKFLVDKDYGIIVPYFKEGIGQTIYKELLRDKYLKEEISEKIRLFYVALTRAREKIIMVAPSEDFINSTNCDTVLPTTMKTGYRSFLDILNSIDFRINSYVTNIDLSNLNLTHDYNLIKKDNYKMSIDTSDVKLNVVEINVDNNIVKEQSFSKKNHELISNVDYNNMKFGIEMHEILELMDFKNPDFNLIENKYCRSLVEKFLQNEMFLKIKEAVIYKEYEFIYNVDDTEYHGIIDLMLEYVDHIDIIDYKLKNTNDSNYNKQLLGYKSYIQTKSSKKINLYLYSLIENKFYKID